MTEAPKKSRVVGGTLSEKRSKLPKPEVPLTPEGRTLWLKARMLRLNRDLHFKELHRLKRPRLEEVEEGDRRDPVPREITITTSTKLRLGEEEEGPEQVTTTITTTPSTDDPAIEEQDEQEPYSISAFEPLIVGDSARSTPYQFRESPDVSTTELVDQAPDPVEFTVEARPNKLESQEDSSPAPQPVVSEESTETHPPVAPEQPPPPPVTTSTSFQLTAEQALGFLKVIAAGCFALMAAVVVAAVWIPANMASKDTVQRLETKMDGQVDKLSADIQALKVSNAELSTEVKGLNNSIGALVAQVKELTTEIQTMKLEMMQKKR